MKHAIFLFALLVSSPVFAEQKGVVQELEQSLSAYQALSGRMNNYDVVFRRDPMRPLLNKDGDMLFSSGMSGGMSVQGIIWSDEHPLVVADNDLLRVGDLVGPYLIAEIRPDGVVVIRGKREQFIPLDRGIQPPVPQVEPSSDASESASSGVSGTPADPAVSAPSEAP